MEHNWSYNDAEVNEEWVDGEPVKDEQAEILDVLGETTADALVISSPSFLDYQTL